MVVEATLTLVGGAGVEKREIETALQRLQDHLDEVVEERNFVLNQSGRHIPGHVVRDYEATIERLEKEINHLRYMLAGKEESKN